jgi:hypothetical protein
MQLQQEKNLDLLMILKNYNYYFRRFGPYKFHKYRTNNFKLLTFNFRVSEAHLFGTVSLSV